MGAILCSFHCGPKPEGQPPAMLFPRAEDRRSCPALLCCAVLCCATPRCAVLCRAMVCRAVPCRAELLEQVQGTMLASSCWARAQD